MKIKTVMKTIEHIAKHLREVYFGRNWTASNLKDQLSDVNYEEANTQILDFNTIAVLVQHLHYYSQTVSQYFSGNKFESKDELSFKLPPVTSENEWQDLLQKIWKEAETFAQQIETLEDGKEDDFFIEEKYGTYYRNLQGIVEHAHYHLGQIVLLKKLIRQPQ